MKLPRFLLADSDPNASLPFIVHTQSPQFFALVTPKIETQSPKDPLPIDFRKAIRGLNLYPGFLTKPDITSAEHLMGLLNESAYYMLEHSLGPAARDRLKDENISVVWRETGTYAPEHMLAEADDGNYVIRTVVPRMIVQQQTGDEMAIRWQEDASLETTAKALKEVVKFCRDYRDQEMAI